MNQSSECSAHDTHRRTPTLTSSKLYNSSPERGWRLVSALRGRASWTLFAEPCSPRTCRHPDSIATPDRPRLDSCRAPPWGYRSVLQSVRRLPPLIGRSSGRLDYQLSVLGASWQLCKKSVSTIPGMTSET